MDWLKKWLTWPKLAAILSILFGGNAALGLSQGAAINSGAVAPSVGIAIAAAVAGGLGAYNRRVVKVEAVGEDIPAELAEVMRAVWVLSNSPLVTAEQAATVAGILAEAVKAWRAMAPEQSAAAVTDQLIERLRAVR